LEKDALEHLAAELGLQPTYRKAKGYYQEMVDKYHREHERETRRNDTILETRGMFGWRGKIKPSSQVNKSATKTHSCPQSILEARRLLPQYVPEEIQELVEAHEWIDSYCYLKMYKRKYQPYTYLLYGKISKTWESQSPNRVLVRNIRQSQYLCQYESELFHIYRMLNVTYQPGYEKVVGNHRMIGNEWHKDFHVGATQTQTESSRTQQQQQQQPEGGAFDMRQCWKYQMIIRKIIPHHQTQIQMTKPILLIPASTKKTTTISK